jgi:hypothetical protein
MKICSICKNSKSIELFAFRNKEKGTRHTSCNDCRHAGQKKSYYKNHKTNLDRIYEYKKVKVDWFKSLKLTFKCCVCSEDDPSCLDFHHLDSSQKDFNLGSCTKNYSKKRIIEELNKCACLCSNCHRKLHAGKINPSLVKLDII